MSVVHKEFRHDVLPSGITAFGNLTKCFLRKCTALPWGSLKSDSKIDEKLNLIETFIDKKSNLIIKEKDSEYKFKPKEHDKNDPELITETLAKILTNQKKYKKAIKAYKILSLKYPKKSSFFADHIKKIKRLEKK